MPVGRLYYYCALLLAVSSSKLEYRSHAFDTTTIRIQTQKPTIRRPQVSTVKTTTTPLWMGNGGWDNDGFLDALSASNTGQDPYLYSTNDPTQQVQPSVQVAAAPEGSRSEIPVEDIPGASLTEEQKARIKASHTEEEERSQGGKKFRELLERAKQKQQPAPAAPPAPAPAPAPPPPQYQSYTQPVQQQPPQQQPSLLQTLQPYIPPNAMELSIEDQARLFRELMWLQQHRKLSQRQPYSQQQQQQQQPPPPSFDPYSQQQQQQPPPSFDPYSQQQQQQPYTSSSNTQQQQQQQQQFDLPGFNNPLFARRQQQQQPPPPKTNNYLPPEIRQYQQKKQQAQPPPPQQQPYANFQQQQQQQQQQTDLPGFNNPLFAQQQQQPPQQQQVNNYLPPEIRQQQQPPPPLPNPYDLLPPPQAAAIPQNPNGRTNYLREDIGFDGRKIGRNRDAEAISNTADAYLAQLKKDSTLRNLARYRGDEAKANAIQLDPTIQPPMESEHRREQRLKQQDMYETIPEEMLLFQEYERSTEAHQKLLPSGVSYKEKLAQYRQGKKSSNTT